MKKFLLALVSVSLLSGSVSGILTHTAFAASFTLSAAVPALAIGRSAPITLTILNGGGNANGVVVDAEIYNNASGLRVFQQTFENQTLSPGAPQNYTINWTPGGSGAYTLKAGIFAQNWSSLLFWADNLATLNVPAPATVAISPAAVTVQAGNKQQFTATVTGMNNTGVFWSATNGSIDQNGLYTAPAAAGSATITAASVVNGSRSASASVTITASLPAFGISGTMNPASPFVNHGIAFSTDVVNNGGSANGVLVDEEIYNASGIRVFQQLFQNQNFAAGGRQIYSANWTPAAAGQYTVKAGVFSGDWARLYYWNDSVLGFLVQNQIPPTVSISASPATITLGQTITLTWSSANATACSATGDWSGVKAATGSETLTPGAAGTKNYTLACSGAGGSISQSTAVTVSVPLPPPPPPPLPSAAPFIVTATVPANLSANQTAPIAIAVTNNGAPTSGDIFDVEIYNAAGVRSFQQTFDNQTFNSLSTQNYSVNWTPSAQGTYTIKAGIFGQNWSSLIFWKDNAATLAVGNTIAPPPNPTPTPTPPPPPPTAGNPLSGVKFYVDPNSPAKAQADAWRASRPADAHRMDIIAAQSGAVWFGGWNANVAQDVKNLVDAAQSQGALPQLVAYNIPQRDCGGFSAGGANNPDGYKAWIRAFASGIAGRRAVVILEPDALPGMDCLSAADQATRASLLSDAVQVLKSQGANVYIDAGHSGWIAVNTMASRLQNAGVGMADGFSLNVSNFYTTSDNANYGQQISSLAGGKHFVIDTSRNGNGSNGEWCNPSGRALGALSTAATGNNLLDAELWIKVPGESDGNCNGGPSAGTWWPEYALGLAVNAGY